MHKKGSKINKARLYILFFSTILLLFLFLFLMKHSFCRNLASYKRAITDAEHRIDSMMITTMTDKASKSIEGSFDGFFLIEPDSF